MLRFNCTPSISQRPLLLPSVSPIRVSPPSQSFFPPTRSFRISESHHRSSIKRLKVSCFRHEEFSSETSKPEAVDDVLHEDLQEPEINKPSRSKGSWVSILQEAAAAVIGAINEPWIVPWTGETILQVTLLWITAFWFVGSWLVPFGAGMMGFNKVSLTYRGQALLSLLTDVIEGLAGAAILYRCLSQFRPLPSDWFRFSMRGNWLFDVTIGCLMFPLVNRLSQFNLDLLPLLPSTPVSSIEHSIMARDPVAMALYAVLLTVCSPMWEEMVFRGFLLPSLTKYMPIWCSILVSSVAFALVHLNVYRMLPLIFLGVVMGVIYTRSRNLLPSILLHSLWNCFVFLDLMK